MFIKYFFNIISIINVIKFKNINKIIFLFINEIIFLFKNYLILN